MQESPPIFGNIASNTGNVGRKKYLALLTVGMLAAGLASSSCARPKTIECQAVGEWHPLNPLADFEAYAKVLGVPVPQVREGKVGEVTCSEQIGPDDGLVKVTVDNVGFGYASQCAVVGIRRLGPLPSPSSDTLGVIGMRMDAMCPALPERMPTAI